MDDYDKEDKVEMLIDAQGHLSHAIELLEEVFPNDEYVKAYMIDHLKIKASADHGFLSSDLNMDMLIERLEGGDD